MNTLFRNDDVSCETLVEQFKHFCAVFHKYGYLQLHGITLNGWTEERFEVSDKCNGIYSFSKPIDQMNPKEIIQASQGKFLGDNKELVDYINKIPDPIALHGKYHYNFTQLSEAEQEEDIVASLKICSELFPHKVIKDFIPPYNAYNVSTQKICKKYGLTLHTDQGAHLEAMIHYANQCALEEGQEYRYHHHRFYNSSTFNHYDLSIEKLNRFFMETSTLRPILSIAEYELCIKQHEAQAWYGYAYKNFEKLQQCYLPYWWIRENVQRFASVVETGCGAGGVLHMLWHEGFNNLFGYDIDEKSINAARCILTKMNSNIQFFVHDCTRNLGKKTFDVILGMNWIYLLENFGLEKFIQIMIPHLNDNGFFVFDTIDSSFNKNPLHMYYTQDWKKEESKRAPSEYKERFAEQEVKELLIKAGMTHIKTFDVQYTIPRKVYVFQKNIQ